MRLRKRLLCEKESVSVSLIVGMCVFVNVFVNDLDCMCVCKFLLRGYICIHMVCMCLQTFAVRMG